MPSLTLVPPGTINERIRAQTVLHFKAGLTFDAACDKLLENGFTVSDLVDFADWRKCHPATMADLI